MLLDLLPLVCVGPTQTDSYFMNCFGSIRSAYLPTQIQVYVYYLHNASLIISLLSKTVLKFQISHFNNDLNYPSHLIVKDYA